MKPTIKIPTLAGLGVLLVSMVLGTLLITRSQPLSLWTSASVSEEPQQITVANLSGTSASIYWQTRSSISGFVKAGPTTRLNSTFKDDRDISTPQSYQLHFVTLTNLTPKTTYYYKVVSGAKTYPAGKPLSFQTPDILPPSGNGSITGTVVDANLQPVSEALVTAQIPGAQTVAAITKIGGGYIIPLTELKNDQFTQVIQLTASTSAVLKVFNLDQSSQVNVFLPSPETGLPKVILGRN